MGFGEIRIDGQRFGEILIGQVQISSVFINQRKIIVGLLVSGLQPNRMLQIADGLLEHFQFAENNFDKVRRLPALYRVVDGYETPVNSRVIKGTIVAETTSDKWTLRSGDAYLCIRSKI